MNNMTSPKLTEANPEAETPDPGNKRSQERPLTPDEQLDVGVEDSMIASDPPASVAPGDDGEPHPSSGFNQEEEKRR